VRSRDRIRRSRAPGVRAIALALAALAYTACAATPTEIAAQAV